MKKFPLILSILLSLLLMMASCHRRSGVSRAMRRIEKTKDEKAEVVKKQYDKAIQKHMKIQGKETRRRMKQTQKESKDYNNKVIGK
ncbi:MAG: hypothetical protein NTU44_19520 [Bacteroidetes bacterium]|nr:hypothetical protein [Bacteroidota bacterium]